MDTNHRDRESPQNGEHLEQVSPGTDAPEGSDDNSVPLMSTESLNDSTPDGISQDSPELEPSEPDESEVDLSESSQRPQLGEHAPIEGDATTTFSERLFPEPPTRPAVVEPDLDREEFLELGNSEAQTEPFRTGTESLPAAADDSALSEVADSDLETPRGNSVANSVVDGPADMAPPLAETRVGGAAPSVQRERSAKERLLHSARPRFTRAQVLTALLLGLLGFMLVAQLQLSQKDELTGLRQSELISLLDEVTRRTDDLEAEERRLNSLLDELQSGQNTQEIAKEAAEENAEVQGILSGRLPATGPGVMIEIQEGETPLRPQVLFNVLEELRNAGSEAVEVNGVRLVASSYFSELDGDIAVNGQILQAPYVWYAIGDPATIQPALEIPGGAMPSVRSGSGSATVTAMDEVTVSAVVNVREPEFAKPDTSDN